MSYADFSFFHPLRVRWAEADMQGIVFNGHYLTYFDVAFTEYFRAVGLPGALVQAANGKEMFTRKATLEYLAPARFDDLIEIGMRCAGLGRSSMRLVVEIYRADQHLIAGELIYVHADTTLRKGVAIPDDWRATITAFEKLTPEQL